MSEKLNEGFPKINLRIHYLSPKDKSSLQSAHDLIEFYASQGLMLSEPVDHLALMAGKKNLLAASVKGNVVGTAGFTFEYPDGTKEFGAWAVKPDLTHHKIGLSLLGSLLFEYPHPVVNSKIIALANTNSYPIFAGLGAAVKNESGLHPTVFEPCQSCKCPGKETLPAGRLCVDTVMDLTTISYELIKAKLGHPPIAGDLDNFWEGPVPSIR